MAWRARRDLAMRSPRLRCALQGRLWRRRLSALVVGLAAVAACLVGAPQPALSQAPAPTGPRQPAPVPLSMLQAIFKRPAAAAPAPADLIALGRKLFHEKRLSADGSTACASCHQPSRSFTDGRRLARGITGVERPRNTPSLWNLSQAKALYWDGRAPTLEAQARVPIEEPDEMGLPVAIAVLRLSSAPAYVEAFAAAFPANPTSRRSPGRRHRRLRAHAGIATDPLRPLDRRRRGGHERVRVSGFRLFTGRAQCLACHCGWRFADERFHDIGLPSADPGRGGLRGSAACRTASRRRASGRCAGRPPTCTTARSAGSRTCSATMPAASSGARRWRRSCGG